jgi:hypothetical protein
MRKLLSSIFAAAALSVPVATLPAANASTTTSRPAVTDNISKARQALEKLPGVRPQDNINCWSRVSIKSTFNNKYVSAELNETGDNYGMLRARATTVGPWETFTVCRDQDNFYTVMSSNANNMFVSTEKHDPHRKLRAAATTAYGWEFFLSPNNPGSGSTWFRELTSPQLYVSAKVGTPADVIMLQVLGIGVHEREMFSW